MSNDWKASLLSEAYSALGMPANGLSETLWGIVLQAKNEADRYYAFSILTYSEPVIRGDTEKAMAILKVTDNEDIARRMVIMLGVHCRLSRDPEALALLDSVAGRFSWSGNVLRSIRCSRDSILGKTLNDSVKNSIVQLKSFGMSLEDVKKNIKMIYSLDDDRIDEYFEAEE